MTHTSVFILCAILLPLLVSCTERKSYIVYFGHHNGEKTHEEIEGHHRSYLVSLKQSEEEAKISLLYSYKNSINGFAAMLTPDEAFKLSELDEVVSVFRSKAQNLQTIRSWEFLGVRKSEEGNVTDKNDLLVKAGYGKQIIVGLFDTGIWPESISFSDRDMEPVPKRWKGICEHGDAFNSSHCNKKLIGARYYFKGYEKEYGSINHTLTYKSARDYFGHGTHTSSIVGGRIVHANYKGYAQGTASGGAPLVRLAMYKVCWPDGEDGTLCMEEDILAAFDDAIGDGVDVLSLSIGGGKFLHLDYIDNTIAIGSLHATKENIVVSCAGGNSGPSKSTLYNTAPWVITVAASSVDRAFVSPVSLGNGMKIPGESMTEYKLEEKMYPLVYAGEIEETNVTKNSSGLCLPGSLSPRKTKGKIVLCSRGNVPVLSISEVVKRAGGVGLIMHNNHAYDDVTDEKSYVLPDTEVGSTNIQEILKYINSTQNPSAYINPVRMVLNVKPAPYMATFSSRGPNSLAPDILKPDITAPGIHILAAWSEVLPTPQTKISPTSEKFIFASGTSMATPHVSAVAALLKAIHPTWSSAAIRSAIMTTAAQTNNMEMPIKESNGNKADPFQYGSGHIHPTSAADPGLVYDATYTDYLLFICYKYSKSLDKSFKCPQDPPSLINLNYPSLAISKLNRTVTIERTVTNVGDSGATYVSQVDAPEGVYVDVLPTKLIFKRSGEKKRFTITVKAKKSKTKTNLGDDEDVNNYVFGWYSWSDGVHVVQSPMAINLA